MSAIANLNSENNTFRKLFGNGLSYIVPTFQRDYSWEEEQWEELWEDLEIANRENSSHYMGYLVLRTNNDKSFYIIDGQQRLTTIGIIILAVLKKLQCLIDNNNEQDENKQRFNLIRNTYIGLQDPVSLSTKNKLTLNRNNDGYFKQYLVTLNIDGKKRGLHNSEKLMRNAFSWFFKKIDNILSGEQLAKLIENICDRLFFTVITVSDEINAYSIFETLNSRGVKLSATDLLKNYLFSLCKDNDDDLQILEDRWNKIIDRLQNEDIKDYVRTFWNSQNTLVRYNGLFKEIRSLVRTREQLFNFIKNLEDNLDKYLNIKYPDDAEWSDDKKINNEINDNMKTLKLFGIKQPFSLLLSACNKLSIEEFVKLSKIIKVISFRYNIIGNYSPNEQERIYNSIAVKISQNEITDLNGIIQGLKNIYISDDRFEIDFVEKSFPKITKVVRYILFALEHHLKNDSPTDSNQYNIEHILPKNAPDDWGGFRDDEMSQFCDRLGNLTLIRDSDNRDIGVKKYHEKIGIYKDSVFRITNSLPEYYDEWTPENIIKRQEYMAKQAKAIWNISQFNQNQIFSGNLKQLSLE